MKYKFEIGDIVQHKAGGYRRYLILARGQMEEGNGTKCILYTVSHPEGRGYISEDELEKYPKQYPKQYQEGKWMI